MVTGGLFCYKHAKGMKGSKCQLLIFVISDP